MPSWHRNVLFSWLDSYDYVQNVVVALLYLQVVCGLVGSIGALYTGIVLANLVVALFGLIAIASGYQTLGRAYVVFLACLICLDIVWFFFFAIDIRTCRKNSCQSFTPLSKWAIISLQITFISECVAFIVRILSVLLWWQMYRLGPSDSLSHYHAADYDPFARYGSTASSSPLPRETSVSDDVLGTTIYYPETYASLFQTSQPYYFSPEREFLREKDDGREGEVFQSFEADASERPQEEESLPDL